MNGKGVFPKASVFPSQADKATLAATLGIVLTTLAMRKAILGATPEIGGNPHKGVSRCRKRGVKFKGGSLRDGFGRFDGFGGSGEHLALLLLVL